MAEGATGLFEDKYHDVVRVVSMGDFSKELCGGTHAQNTAQLQVFTLLSEQGVSSGVRRIEAVTGRGALQKMREKEETLLALAGLLKSAPEHVLQRSAALLEENRELKREMQSYEAKMAGELSRQLDSSIQTVEGVSVLASRVDGKTMEELKDLADALKANHADSVLALAAATEGKVYWVVSIADSFVKKGLKAGELVKLLAQKTGGNGGGRPQFATAGGKDTAKIDEALQSVNAWVKEKLA